MNFLVCVKQVPDTTEIKIDPVTKTLMRAGVPSIVNPFDGYALELAARLKDSVGGRITLLSMGPAQAEAALRSCLAVGADEAYLISGREFGGSDTLATSYILSCGIRYLEKKNGQPFDLIFCGKQAIDGDTGQVGPEIGEHLGRGQATCVTEAEADEGGKTVTVTRDTDDGYDRLRLTLPGIITVTKPAYESRMASIRSKLAATRAVIPRLTLEELTDIDAGRIGLKGSPTKVKKTFTPDISSDCTWIDGTYPAQTAGRLAEILDQLKVL